MSQTDAHLTGQQREQVSQLVTDLNRLTSDQAPFISDPEGHYADWLKIKAVYEEIDSMLPVQLAAP